MIPVRWPSECHYTTCGFIQSRVSVWVMHKSIIQRLFPGFPFGKQLLLNHATVSKAFDFIAAAIGSQRVAFQLA